MKKSYGEIVNIASIGAASNPIKLSELLVEAQNEKLRPSAIDPEKILVIGIDFQNDFMENGSLPVANSHKDVANFTKFIYDNAESISQIAMTIDTHKPYQIFHACWFVNDKGENPTPYTAITAKDIEDGTWRPVIHPVETLEYCKQLEKAGKKVLLTWAYHCIQGTFGHALENQLTNMIYYHSVAKKTTVQTIVKGTDPLSEMYGAIKPEYDPKGVINKAFLNKIEKFDKVVIGGEAADFCVYETMKQILEYFENKPAVLKKIYFLEDCTSAVIDTPEQLKQRYEDMKKKYGINIVKSTEFKL